VAWPTNDDFRGFLGLAASDQWDTDATQAALDAAQADAVAVGVDPTAGPSDARQLQALYTLAGVWLGARNRPDTWSPGSDTRAERRAMLGVLRGAAVVAT
jgi:hypothetical protein